LHDRVTRPYASCVAVVEARLGRIAVSGIVMAANPTTTLAISVPIPVPGDPETVAC
jgi:hypothetical protein